MTQKELLYFEDAIGHEESIVKIIDDDKNRLQDERLISFMEEERNKHQSIKNKLLNLLEEKVNG